MRTRSVPPLLLAALVLLLPALAGCLGGAGPGDVGPNGEPGPSRADLVDAVEARRAGEEAANVELLGAWPEGPTQEADAWDDHLFVDRGDTVHILDAADPGNLTELSSVSFPQVVDVKVSDDGQWMFTVEDEVLSGEPLGGTGPFVGGFYVTNVSDKENPERTSYLPVGYQRGPHMVAYHRMPDGAEIVLGAAGPDVVLAEFDRGAGTLTEIARYAPGQLAQDRDPNRLGVLYNPQGWVHDMFVQAEPDGTVLMYVAAWDAGLRVVDITDPADPEEVGAWRDYGDREAGNLHTVATAWVGDRRITVGSVEVGFAVVGGTHYLMGNEKPVVYVWDTTDPADPTLLGRWVNPVKDTAGRDQFDGEQVDSPHNLQLEEGRVYLAHYDLGVWVLDVSTPDNQSAPKVLGYYDDGRMNTWDVVLADGVMFSSGRVGVQALNFLLDAVGPGGVTSRA